MASSTWIGTSEKDTSDGSYVAGFIHAGGTHASTQGGSTMIGSETFPTVVKFPEGTREALEQSGRRDTGAVGSGYGG